jgi:glyoxylase-like metal-dependent hydrolase (beta-lactamase superfamily II)
MWCVACTDKAHAVTLVKICDQEEVPLARFIGYYNDLDSPGRDAKREAMVHVGVVDTGDGLLLVNAGVSPKNKRVKNKQVKNFKDTVEALKRAGVKRKDVKHIVLTDVHWSTAGMLEGFPSAKVYLQRQEYLHLNWRHAKNRLKKLKKKDRLVLLNGDEEIVDGVRVRLGGRVSDGNQVVIVDTAKGSVVFMGALAPFYENITRRSGPTYGYTRHGASLAIRKLADEFQILIPKRDQEIANKFKQLKPGAWLVAPGLK